MNTRRALLLGATGLVGREILRLLLDDPVFARVIVVTRRPTGIRHPRLDERVFDLGEMAAHAGAFVVDDVFCALGTTIKVAGTQERFRVVDHQYPLEAARLGRANGATHYLLVSALGANARSRIFYSRVKGEVERDVIAAGYPRVTIARPALLLGERSEIRIGERVMERLGWLMPASSKPIPARAVAQALVEAARTPGQGVQILDSKSMRTKYS